MNVCAFFDVKVLSKTESGQKSCVKEHEELDCMLQWDSQWPLDVFIEGLRSKLECRSSLYYHVGAYTVTD